MSPGLKVPYEPRLKPPAPHPACEPLEPGLVMRPELMRLFGLDESPFSTNGKRKENRSLMSNRVQQGSQRKRRKRKRKPGATSSRMSQRKNELSRKEEKKPDA